MPAELESAWARDQLRRLGVGAAPPIADVMQSQTFRAIADEGYQQRVEAQRGRAFGGLVKTSDPRRGDGFLIQGFDEAATKAEKVKQAVDLLGPAGEKSSAVLAAGFNTALAGMETSAAATIARIQKQLDSLKAPHLSFGGPGGLNTGRSMGEVR